ncbi:MAG: hypothetical protein P8Q14_11050, partial [Vicingaceae bacterium]|nr:hypothetical protein [Vicingaceae bacterium]
YLLDDGFTSIVFKDKVSFELEDAIELDNYTYDWVEGSSFVTLVDARNIRSNISHKARDYFAKNEKITNIRKGQAIVVNSLHTKLLANFYMNFHKPKDPVKIFTDYNKAYDWIQDIRSIWFKEKVNVL